jgi:hypothetical protein
MFVDPLVAARGAITVLPGAVPLGTAAPGTAPGAGGAGMAPGAGTAPGAAGPTGAPGPGNAGARFAPGRFVAPSPGRVKNDGRFVVGAAPGAAGVAPGAAGDAGGGGIWANAQTVAALNASKVHFVFTGPLIFSPGRLSAPVRSFAPVHWLTPAPPVSSFQMAIVGKSSLSSALERWLSHAWPCQSFVV